MVTLKIKVNKQLSTTTDISVRETTGNLGDVFFYQDADGNTQQGTNTTGYGADTFFKNTVARILLARYEGRESKFLVYPKGYNAADPLVESFDFAYPQDGWIRFVLVAYSIYNASATYIAGNRAFHPSAESPYSGVVKEFDGTKWNTVSWEAVYDFPEKATASTVLNKLFHRNGWNRFRDYLIWMNENADDCCQKDQYAYEVKSMQHKRLAASAVDAFCRNLRPEAQRITETLNTFWKGVQF